MLPRHNNNNKQGLWILPPISHSGFTSRAVWIRGIITATSKCLNIHMACGYWMKTDFKKNQVKGNCYVFLKGFPEKQFRKSKYLCGTYHLCSAEFVFERLFPSKPFLQPSLELLGRPEQRWTVVMSEASVWLNVRLFPSVLPLPAAAPLCSCTLSLAYAAVILHTVPLAKWNNCTVCVSDAPALPSF